MINPYKNREKSTRGIKTAEWIMRATATVITSIGAFIWAKSTALDYMPEGLDASWAFWLSVAAGLVCAGVMAYVTDYMFGDLLQRVVYDVLAARHPNVVKWQGEGYFKKLRIMESVGFGVLLVALLAFDMATALIIRDPIADQARQEQQYDVSAKKAAAHASVKAASDPIAEQIKGLESQIKKEKYSVIASNPALVKLKNSGNGWAASELSKKTSKATKAMEADVEKLRATYINTLNAGTESVDKESQQLLAENERIAQSNATKRSIMANMYTMFSVIPKALAIILRIMMVVSFLAYSQRFNPDLTGDGIIDYADVEEYYAQQKSAVAEKTNRAAQHATRNQTPPPQPDFQ